MSPALGSRVPSATASLRQSSFEQPAVKSHHLSSCSCRNSFTRWRMDNFARTAQCMKSKSNWPWKFIASLQDLRGPRIVQSLERLPLKQLNEGKAPMLQFPGSLKPATGLLLAIALLFSEPDFQYAHASTRSAETVAVDNDGGGGCQRVELEKRRRKDLRFIDVGGGIAHAKRPSEHRRILLDVASGVAATEVRGTDSRLDSTTRGSLPPPPSSSSLSPSNPAAAEQVQEEVQQQHEGPEDSSSSAKTYGRILQGRDDMAEKRAMFTDDAWAGMVQLKKYGELVESLEAEEKLCVACARNRRLLERVWQTVSNEYYDQYGRFSQAKWSSALYDTLLKAGGLLRSRSQTYAAVRQMVASLGDKYSAFLNPDQYRIAIRRPLPSDIKYLTLQYSGVGIELGKRSPSGGLVVVAPFAGSPAEEAGIVGGDRLLRVDDTSVDLLSADEAVALLRGPVGSMVELELSSAQPERSARTIVLERRGLPLPPLKMRLVDCGDGQVLAYMRLHYFTHEGTKKMAGAIREGEALGVDGYILDLRNNPGGVFEEAIAMAALWLDCNGCDVAETVRTSDFDVEDLIYTVNHLPKEIFSRHPGTLTHAPLAIITNRSSASASEVLTGALHDNKRATIVGEKTFGKGVVQYFFPMDDGSGLKLTVAKYLTPSRYDISKQGGLLPDLSCNDYPHGTGESDKCIEEAIAMLAGKQKDRSTVILPGTLPYRWLPLSEKMPWESGSY